MQKSNMRLLSTYWALLALMTAACGVRETVAVTEVDPRQPTGDTTGVSLTDLKNRTSLGFAGGLYAGGADVQPDDHAAVGL
ncbi:MAG: hypothetical protein ABI120_24220, partial [Gemmatimonadaceae bacterium]